jgi:hypothetical protein
MDSADCVVVEFEASLAAGCARVQIRAWLSAFVPTWFSREKHLHAQWEEVVLMLGC